MKLQDNIKTHRLEWRFHFLTTWYKMHEDIIQKREMYIIEFAGLDEN